MTLNESTVEYAALTWFGNLGYAVGHGPDFSPGEPGAEPACAAHADRWASFGEVVQWRFAPTLIPAFSHGVKGEEREAIRWLHLVIRQASNVKLSL